MSNDPTNEELEKNFKKQMKVKEDIKIAEKEYLTLLKQKTSKLKYQSTHFKHQRLGWLPNSEKNKISKDTGKKLGDEEV